MKNDTTHKVDKKEMKNDATHNVDKKISSQGRGVSFFIDLP